MCDVRTKAANGLCVLRPFSLDSYDSVDLIDCGPVYLCVIAQYSDAGCSAFRTAAFRLICTVLLWAVDKVRDAKTQAGALGPGRIRGGAGLIRLRANGDYGISPGSQQPRAGPHPEVFMADLDIWRNFVSHCF